MAPSAILLCVTTRSVTGIHDRLLLWSMLVPHRQIVLVPCRWIVLVPRSRVVLVPRILFHEVTPARIVTMRIMGVMGVMMMARVLIDYIAVVDSHYSARPGLLL